MTMPPSFTALTLVFSAAGFIATSASTSSPGVKMSVLEKWIWYPDTPARVPAGARISAGKSGSVLMSLPSRALVSVNCVPANCMPSPLSPQNRMVTFGSVRTGLCRAGRSGAGGGAGAVGTVEAPETLDSVVTLMMFPDRRPRTSDLDSGLKAAPAPRAQLLASRLQSRTRNPKPGTRKPVSSADFRPAMARLRLRRSTHFSDTPRHDFTFDVFTSYSLSRQTHRPPASRGLNDGMT